MPLVARAVTFTYTTRSPCTGPGSPAGPAPPSPPPPRPRALPRPWAGRARGLVVAFAVPYLLADVLEINRDLFYGLYAAAVIALFALWSRSTGYDLVAAARRRWLAALLLGIAV